MNSTPINIISATQTGAYRIRLVFDDNTVQEVDFKAFLVPAHTTHTSAPIVFQINNFQAV